MNKICDEFDLNNDNDIYFSPESLVRFIKKKKDNESNINNLNNYEEEQFENS